MAQQRGPAVCLAGFVEEVALELTWTVSNTPGAKKQEQGIVPWRNSLCKGSEVWEHMVCLGTS